MTSSASISIHGFRNPMPAPVRRAFYLFERHRDELDKAREVAEEIHGRQPLALITWRNYFIGGHEIDYRRQALLQSGEDEPEIIEQEYRDAKKRYDAALKAERDWEKRVGSDTPCKTFDEAFAEFRAAHESLGTVEVLSPTQQH